MFGKYSKVQTRSIETPESVVVQMSFSSIQKELKYQKKKNECGRTDPNFNLQFQLVSRNYDMTMLCLHN
jgi:hypothetical protein